jgi:hypothetical protein
MGPLAPDRLREGDAEGPEGDRGVSIRFYRVNNFRRRDLQRAMRPMGTSEIEIDRVLHIFRGRRWNRTAVGRYINLTFARWELLGARARRGKYRLGLRHIWPGDRTAEQMRQYLKDRRREAERERQKENRAMNPKGKIKQISPRARVLAAMLTDDWTESRQFVDRVKQRWLNSAGNQLKGGALAKAFQRAARELCDVSIAEQKIELRSGGTIRFLRWNPTSTFRREDFNISLSVRDSVPGDSVSGYKNAYAQRRSTAKPGISDPGLLDKTARTLESLSSYERTRPPRKRPGPKRSGPRSGNGSGADAPVA